MQVFGEEGKRRVEKHHKQREGKGFITLERPASLEDIPERCAKGVVLLECLSNRLANAMFSQKLYDAKEEILKEIREISKVADLIIVTNEVFSDDIYYDKETMSYIEKLGSLNCEIVNMSDFAVESVYGLLNVLKGENYANCLEWV